MLLMIATIQFSWRCLESSPATNNHQGGLRDSDDESDTKIFSVPDSETGQQSVPHIQLELMPRQPQLAYVNADKVLVKTNFDHDDVYHFMIKVSYSIFTTAKCKCTMITLLNDSNFPFSNFLNKVEYPLFGRHSLNYRWLQFSFSRLGCSTFKFSFN